MSDELYLDFLTGIYSRSWLFERSPALSLGSELSLLYMDLDNFKTVNDVYGHEEGDRVLKCMADALLENTGEDGYAIRMSGDEFVMFFSVVKTRDELSEIYHNILTSLFRHRGEIAGISVISVSAGAVLRGEDGNTLADLLRMGDDTLYAAKRSGKRRCIFHEDIREMSALEHRIREEAKGAVTENRFQLRLLPFLNLQSSLLEHTQVAAVWMCSDGSTLMPEVYRPVLETNGYIRELDLYILEKLFRLIDQRQYSRGYHKKIRFSIELSWINFMDRHLENKLRSFFEKYQVTPDEIDICVDENALQARNTERVVFGMERIVDMGVTLSLRNFGSNFLSLRYLDALRISRMIFDATLVQDSLRSPTRKKTLKNIIRLLKDNGKAVSVPGGPEPEGRRFLALCGCDAVCGKYEESLISPEVFRAFIKGRVERDAVIYRFDGDLSDQGGANTGLIRGEGISYVPGISRSWGGLHFSGGDTGQNLVELPAPLFGSNSFTFAFWLYPEAELAWTSILYMRYEGGFSSYVPYTNAGGGISCFRISSDKDGFFDTTCRAMPLRKWCHICVAYDAMSFSVRYYINGRIGLTLSDQPLQIGCRQVLLGGDPFQKSYEGSISSLRIFDYALPGDEIEKLYRSYAAEPDYRGTVEDYWMETE